eukprot:4780357-Prymnesium_polylepis.1
MTLLRARGAKPPGIRVAGWGRTFAEHWKRVAGAALAQVYWESALWRLGQHPLVKRLTLVTLATMAVQRCVTPAPAAPVDAVTRRPGDDVPLAPL